MIDDPLSILMLEDDAVDQQLLERELRKHIRQLALTWVTGRHDYERARLIAMAFAASRGQMDDFWSARKMRGGTKKKAAAKKK